MRRILPRWMGQKGNECVESHGDATGPFLQFGWFLDLDDVWGRQMLQDSRQ
jgi:hypothetical protein